MAAGSARVGHYGPPDGRQMRHASPFILGDNPACNPIPLARAMRSTSFQTGMNHFRRGKCLP
jgi:hypothetical protein